MLVTPWLRSIKQSVVGHKTRKPASRRRQVLRDSLEPVTRDVERLEDRTLLSAVDFLPDSHVVFIKDFDNVDDNITLDLRFDQTPTHGFGIFLQIQDAKNGLETDDPAFHRVDSDTLLIPLEWVHCFNIFGMKGDDMVEAEDGFFIKIKFDGGEGNDSFWGSLADDHFHGGLGDDEAFGQGGDDKLFGDEGEDTLVGGQGDDFIDGGKDADTLDGGNRTLAANVMRDGKGRIADGDDTILGGDGDDLLIPGTTATIDTNWANGGAGRDTIEATDYNPVFVNSSGDERVVDITVTRGSNPGIKDELFMRGTNIEASFEGDPGGKFDSDRAGGADDPDTEVWEVAATATKFEEVEVIHIKRVLDGMPGQTIGQPVVPGAPWGQLSPNTFNIVDGGAADGIASFDEIGMVFVDAGAGDDTINGGPNADTIYGGDGNDVLNGNAGEDLINGDYAFTKSMGKVVNVIEFDPPYPVPPFMGPPFQKGTPEGPLLVTDKAIGHDVIFGGTGRDTLEGGFGSDTIRGQGGDDFLYAFQHNGDRTGEMDASEGALINVDVDSFYDVLEEPPEAAFVPRKFPDRDSQIDEQDWPGLPISPPILFGGPLNIDLRSGHNLLDGGEGADAIFGGEQRDTIFGGPGGRSDYHDPALSETTTGENQVTEYHLVDYDLIYTGLEFVYDLADPRAEGKSFQMTVTDVNVEDEEGDLVGDHRFSRKFGGDLRNEDGGAGADLIFGTDKQDTLYGGGGHDTIIGGDESNVEAKDPTPPGDFISGGLGNDLLYGDLVPDDDSGDDTVFGNAGDDTILGGGGDDCLRGHAGNDSIAGGTGRDAISGNKGDDWLFGEFEGFGVINQNNPPANPGLADDITGGPGNDYLDGNDGPDILHGGTGNDTLTGNSHDGDDDDIDGGAGHDILFELSDTNEDTYTIDNNSISNTDSKETDALDNIDGAFLDATKNPVMLDSWDGSGFDGAQTLIGSEGEDELSGGSGNDLIIGGTDTQGGGDKDTLFGFGGDDLIFAGWAAFVVGDDSELPGNPMDHLVPSLFTDPEADDQLNLSDFDLSMVDEFIVHDGEKARLLGDPYQGMHVGPKTGGREWLDKLFKDGSDMFGKMNGNYIFSEDDLHILILDPDQQGDPKKGLGPKVETVVKIAGGLEIKAGKFDAITHGVIGQKKLTGVIATGVNPWTGKLDFDDVHMDTVFGDGGDDILIGSAGPDRMQGDGMGASGDDLLVGGDDDDILAGGDGMDTLYGLDGMDNINGNDGDDVLNGGEDDDTIRGAAGDDKLTGGPGNDTISGGTGYDTIFEIANIHARVGRLSDINMPYDGTAKGLLESTTDGFGYGADTIIGTGSDPAADDAVENLFLIGGDDDNDLDASGWQTKVIETPMDNPDTFAMVTLVGLAGDDTLEGSKVAANELDGGSGDDSILGGRRPDFVDGGPGNDTISTDAGNDTVLGWSGDDLIFTDGNDDTVFGDLGNDTIDGGGGNDALLGGPGADVITGGPGTDFLYGDGRYLLLLGEDCPFEPNHGAPDLGDTLDGGIGDDGLSGGDGDDILIGGPDVAADDPDDMVDPNTQHPFTGADLTADGGMLVGNDTLVGGTGDDTLLAGGGNDVLIGQSGNDTLDGETGADTISETADDLVVPDMGGMPDEKFGDTITEGTNQFLSTILIDDPWGKDVFELDGDSRLDWLDAV